MLNYSGNVSLRSSREAYNFVKWINSSHEIICIRPNLVKSLFAKAGLTNDSPSAAFLHFLIGIHWWWNLHWGSSFNLLRLRGLSLIVSNQNIVSGEVLIKRQFVKLTDIYIFYFGYQSCQDIDAESLLDEVLLILE